LSAEFDRAYEVLGVKPGVSDRELKAAHRDLAKVWHPDRFTHDPRLQQKAQEKLKEINEAYEQLISRHKRRVTPSPPPRAQTANITPARVQARVGWHWWLAAPLAIFALVFAFTTKTLLRDRVQSPTAAPIVESTEEQPQAAAAQESTHVVRNRAENNSAPATESEREHGPTNNEAVVAVPTVTVLIDPANGLLARPECPVKSRMTYPSGSEPRGYCNVSHVVKPEKETRIKSIAKRVGIL
jgi:hypothetical protein